MQIQQPHFETTELDYVFLIFVILPRIYVFLSSIRSNSYFSFTPSFIVSFGGKPLLNPVGRVDSRLVWPHPAHYSYPHQALGMLAVIDFVMCISVPSDYKTLGRGLCSFSSHHFLEKSMIHSMHSVSGNQINTWRERSPAWDTWYFHVINVVI